MIAELDEITLETMRNLEVTRKEFWNISKESGLMLHNIILEHNFKNALEIGTSNGYSGLWISKVILRLLSILINDNLLLLKILNDAVFLILYVYFRVWL